MSGNLAVSTINGVDISVSPVATQAFANSLLAEYTVTGSAVTSIDFSELDINTHKSYRVEIELIGSLSATISCYINGDTTATNYYAQVFNAVAATLAGQRRNTAEITGFSIGTPTVAFGLIQIVSGNARMTFNSSRSTATTINMDNYFVAKTATVVNITQITFISSAASGIGIGSKIRIYRGDV